MDLKPERMPIQFDQIPPELIDYNNWILWKWEKRNGQWTKPPYQINGHFAKSNNPKTWSRFDEVYVAYKNGKFDGIGFMLGDDFSGIDWDNCRVPETGEIKPDIMRRIKLINSYTEVSPSKTGCKTLLIGKLPAGGHHSNDIGVFNHTRYFAITGVVLPVVSNKIEPRQTQLDALIREFWPNDFKLLKPQDNKPYAVGHDSIIEKALKSRDTRFSELWVGDISGYDSHSEADLALCTRLAFWTGKDSQQIDVLFRESGLMRDKWNRQDYRERTILAAINATSEVYHAKSNKLALSYYDEIAEERAAIQAEGAVPIQQNRPKCIIQGMGLSGMKKQFSQKINWLWYKHVPAGMPIIINGREGLGKTTVCLQIAKEILDCNLGKSVIWFATEGTVADTFVKATQLSLPDGPFLIASKNGEDYLFNFKRYDERNLLDEFLSCIEIPTAAVFIDSIRGMTSQSVNDEETGNTIRQLNSIVCDKHKAALIYLHHWNKKSGDSWLDRNTGSTAITAAVRLVLSVLPNSKYTRKLVVAKSNIAEEIPTLNVVKQDNDIIFYDESEDTIETAEDTAESFLAELFKSDSQIPAASIYRMGENDGISSDALKRAKSSLGIKSIKTTEGWVWKFPGKGAAREQLPLHGGFLHS